MQQFHTPDAVDLDVKAERYRVMTATLAADGEVPSGIAVYSVTDMFVDQRTQRHARMLLSEAALAASRPTAYATMFVDAAAGREHRVQLYNSSGVSSDVTLRDRDGVIESTWEHRVEAGRQTTVLIEEAASANLSASSTLVIEATEPVTVSGLRRTRNARDEWLLAPIPTAVRSSARGRRLLPLVRSGGGQQTDIVLINGSDEPARGTISIRNSVGERAPLGLD